MNRLKRKGYTVEANLKEYGYEGYSVECTYKYDKKEEKYILRMGLKPHDNTDNRIKIEFQEIDTQYLSGNRENIERHIIKLIEFAARDNFFDDCIKEYEYMCKCFDIGNEILEEEELNKTNNND